MPWGSRQPRPVGRRAAARHPRPQRRAARSRTTAAAIRSAPRSSATPENPADLHARGSRRSPRRTARRSCRSTRRGSTRARRSAATIVGALKTPKVLLAWDTPTQTLSAGWTRYVLERRFGQPVTAVRTSVAGARQLRRLRRHRAAVGQLRRHDRRRRAESHQGLAARRRHAGDAGRGVAVGDREPPSGCSRRRLLLKDGRPDVPSAQVGSRVLGCYRFYGCYGFYGFDRSGGFEARGGVRLRQGDSARSRAAGSQPGAILRVTLDTNHWLTAGNDGETQVDDRRQSRVCAAQARQAAATSASTPPRTS